MSHKRVLIAEDSSVIQNLARKILEFVGVADIRDLEGTIRKNDPTRAIVDHGHAVGHGGDEDRSHLLVDQRLLLLKRLHAVQGVAIFQDDHVAMHRDDSHSGGENQRRDGPSVE